MRPSRTLALRFATFALAVWVAAMDAASAQEAARQYRIAQQSLDQALREFALSSNVDLLFSPDLVAGKKSPTLDGKFTLDEGLRTLLRGSGLEFSVSGSRVVISETKASEATGEKKQASIQTTSAVDPPLNGRMHLAQADSPSSSEQGSPPKLGEVTVTIPEVLVVGSKILNMDIARTEDDAQPYVVFERATIEQSGASNLEEFLKNRLTMNTIGATNSQATTSTLGAQSQINLRGLGANQTLILVDGRRTSNVNSIGTPNQPDINGIPLSAVERIEVLPATASGIYGGSATGGVVNIILRRDYSGSELKVTYDNTFDTDSATRRVDFAAGLNFEEGKTNILLAASYADANALSLQDRNEFVSRAYSRILASRGNDYQALNIFGGRFPPFGATPNIRAVNGENLTLKDGTPLNSPITYVPVGYGGTSTDAGAALVANAGRYNLDLPNSAQVLTGGQQTILRQPVQKNAMATVRRQFSDSIQAFIEARRSESTAENMLGSAIFAGMVSSGASSGNIPASAPNNPFQQAIQVAVPSNSADAQLTSDIEETRLAGGLILVLPMQWQAEIDYTWSESSFSFSSVPGGLNAAGTAAIASGELDVLRDTSLFPIDFTPYLTPAQYTTSPFESTLGDAALRIAGPIFRTPGGRARLATLLEYRDEQLGETTHFLSPSQTLFYPSRSQSVTSAYAELNFPLVSDLNRLPAIQELDLQVAARYDEYVTHGVTGSVQIGSSTPILRATNTVSSLDPTVGLRYRLNNDITFRASYGTGFLPPAVHQVLSSSSVSGNNVIDPLRGNSRVSAIPTLVGGNPDLDPEESETWSLGIVLTPRFLAGLRLSVDYVKVEKEDGIVSAPTDVAILESLGRVTRGPRLPGDPQDWAGPITLLDRTLVNVARVDAEAYDVMLDYEHNIGAGSISAFVAATWQTHLRQQALPTAPFIENVGVGASNPLKLKGNAGITWNAGRWSIGWLTRHFDSYWLNAGHTIDPNQGAASIPSQTYHDAFASYRFGARNADAAGIVGRLIPADISVTVGARNVFNTAPPVQVSNAETAFYSRFGDIRLATYYISAACTF